VQAKQVTDERRLRAMEAGVEGACVAKVGGDESFENADSVRTFL